MRIITASVLFAFLLMIAPRSALADSGPCDKDNAPCITRKALEFKYKADALKEENDILRQELEEERNRSDNRGFTFIAGGIVFLGFVGGFLLAYKNLK